MFILCLSKGLDAISLWRDENNSQKPIAFIPNAGDTYKDPYFVRESKARIEALGFNTEIIDLKEINSSDDFENKLDHCKGIFVAGGNSFNLLNELYRSCALDVIKRRVKEGYPYFGESAGAVILYKSIAPVSMIDDPDDVPNLRSTDALDLVDFITLPHINREKYAPLFNEFFEKYSSTHRIVKIRDDQAILTRDGTSIEIIDSKILELD